jgi:hypothetical protein
VIRGILLLDFDGVDDLLINAVVSTGRRKAQLEPTLH